MTSEPVSAGRSGQRGGRGRGRSSGRGRGGRGRGRSGRGRSQRGGRSSGPRSTGNQDVKEIPETLVVDDDDDGNGDDDDYEGEEDLEVSELTNSLEQSSVKNDPNQVQNSTTSTASSSTNYLNANESQRGGGGRGRGRSGRSSLSVGGRSQSGRSQSSPATGRSQNARGGGPRQVVEESDVHQLSTVPKSQENKRTPSSKSSADQDSNKNKEQSSSERASSKTQQNDSNGTKHRKNEKSANKAENKTRENNKKTSTDVAPLSPSIPPNQPQQTSDINYGKGEKITVLHVAEKPSIAQAIAHGLAGNNAIKAQGRSLPVHEFNDPAFPKAPKASKCAHRVTSVAGHVFSIDFPSQYQSWDSVDPADLFDAPVKKKAPNGSVVKHLQDCARGVDFIVLWMDCDREGENINFEVLECCMHLMHGGPQSSPYDRVYRAYFSAINASDIQKAYHNLGKPDQNQALSVDARQELDLKVGVAFSRFQTRFFQGRYGDLDSAVLSYGPCQTPTLGFCVQRQIDMEMFKPEPYWVLDLSIVKRGRMMHAQWDGGRSFNKGKVEALILKAMEESSIIKVTNVVTKDKKQGRPIPLNTVAMLKACSKALGIGPHATMQAAERLYLSGYLSYPRTESTAYPKSFDIIGTLQQQASDNRWGAYVRELLKEGSNKSRGGVDMGDHPPITPCRAAGPAELSGDMARIYDLVVRHFIASVSHDAVWRSTKVDFCIESLGDKGAFSISGKQIVSPGFLAILLHKEYGDKEEGDRQVGDNDDEEERTIPEFDKGEEIPLLKSSGKAGSSKVSVATGAPCWGSLDIKEKMTTPPTHLTESDLINLMEKNGIGTDASIPTHIENILKRNYAFLETGRRICPTKLGLVLVQGYHQIDSGLVLPTVRSDIEDQCNKIAKGLARREEVVRRAIEIFRNKYDFFVKHIERMDVLFGSSFAKLEDVGKPFTRCGLTRRYLQYIPGPPPRLYNRFTETVYPLPAGGVVKQWTGRKCTVEGCSFELCLYLVGHPQRTFPLCPNCFNSADWALETEDIPEDAVDRDDKNKERSIQRMAGKSLVLECPLPDDHPLIEEVTVGLDPDGEGVLILDPHLGPKWRLVSTRNPTIVHLPQSIEKITVLEQADDVHGVHLMKIEYKAGESPLEGGATKHTVCFPNDEQFQKSTRVFHGSERLKATARGGRGRGRGGRSRGGRGGRGSGRLGRR